MNKQLVGLMLASTLSLSVLVGCNGGLLTGAAQTSATASSDASSETASAMAEERSMDDYATIAGQEDASASAFQVLALDASATANASVATPVLTALSGEVRARVQARQATREASIKGRLDKLATQRAQMRAQLKATNFVVGTNGTSQKSITIDDTRTVNGKAVARHCTLVKTINTDSKETLSWRAEFKQTLPSGLSRVSTRTKTLLADGSYMVVFHSELTLANGRTRTADWSKTIAADGSVSGKGMIVWKDKAGVVVKTSTVTLTGDEDKASAKIEESGGTVAMTTDGQTTVKGDDGKTATVDADSAVGDTDLAADAAVIVTAK
ncbi:MAG: hypothetical protein JWM80_1191 [Cyanobacteria bacterium RYN_339]|nr:hypothetical protein [Cyanobacteria bacterium RYN_339]